MPPRKPPAYIFEHKDRLSSKEYNLKDTTTGRWNNCKLEDQL